MVVGLVMVGWRGATPPDDAAVDMKSRPEGTAPPTVAEPKMTEPAPNPKSGPEPAPDTKPGGLPDEARFCRPAVRASWVVRAS